VSVEDVEAQADAPEAEEGVATRSVVVGDHADEVEAVEQHAALGSSTFRCAPGRVLRRGVRVRLRRVDDVSHDHEQRREETGREEARS